MKISLVIPVYNGEKTLQGLITEIERFFSGNNYAYEVIFVWDCGPDNSWNVIKMLKRKYPEKIKAIKLTKNFGQHNAIIAGIKNAQGDFIVTIDEDMQNSPYDIELLLKTQLTADYDVVYGKYKSNQNGIFRNLTSLIMRKLIQYGVPEVCPDYSSFRLIKSRIAKETLKMKSSYTFLDGYLSCITSHFGTCEVIHYSRIAGKSSYSLNRLFKHSMNIFITFSDLPLKVVKYLSLLFLLFSISYSLLTIYKKIVFSTIVPGYSSTIILVSMGFGLVLFALGVIGEYVHRINQKTTQHPMFIIDDIL